MSMLRTFPVAPLAGLLALLLAACSAAPAPGPAPASATAPVAAAPSPSAEFAAPLPSAGVGVAECDAYLTRYRECIETHVPAADRPRYREAYLQGINALREAVRGTGNTARLGESCHLARDAARTALAGFNCTDF